MIMRKFMAWLVVMIWAGLLVSNCTTPHPPKRPTSPTPVKPSQQSGKADMVLGDMYYRYGHPITEGWNGLPWKASIQEFKARFPNASSPKSDNVSWVTGQGLEEIFGYRLPTTYFFDKRGRFFAVSFAAKDKKELQPVINAMLEHLGLPKKKEIRWDYGPVTVFAFHHYLIIRGVPPKTSGLQRR